MDLKQKHTNKCLNEFGESTLRHYGNHCDSVNCIV